MHPDPWPCRPCPEATGPQLSCELSDPVDLRTMRLRLRTWLPGALVGSRLGREALDRLLLVADELASNGLRHGRAPVRVLAVQTVRGVLVDVSDGDTTREPVPAVGRDPALGGMGLGIVADLTVDRGWDVADGRKHVWAICASVGLARGEVLW